MTHHIDFSKHLASWEQACASSCNFQVLQLASTQKVQDSNKLSIIVHPGDACESQSPDQEIREAALFIQKNMAKEIMSVLESDDNHILIIHRKSSIFAFQPASSRVANEYNQAILNVHIDSNTILWGDDLAALSKWIISNYPHKPSAFLTGAWCDPEWGCITSIGLELLAADWEVSVSPYCPSQPGRVNGGWKPPYKMPPDV